ncbi:MAG: hypothetical protein NTU45_14760 [Planctomycetota bacterium]|nr:hypothetical protein [Planctomycetota bacterium]
MRLPVALIVAASAAFVSLASLPACSSAPRAGAVDTKALENAPFAGAWTSDLDAATLTIEPTGLFSIDVPARGETPARSVVGRWNLDDSGGIVTFTNLGATAMCAEVPGSYAFEIVRDAVRFTKVKDNCPAREEHMAWGWKKPSTKAERGGA